ncbi:hypothetical protein WR25_00475 [Diploscapter pachys]|uniref:Uncharacterized protein n=1 Tax=Diploscapter pachys TaxID=2018661 RepID=A0A2A2JZM9_9BILA|nr:hypothetical protein WR25_00475 [Diploscapter pachys]
MMAADCCWERLAWAGIENMATLASRSDAADSLVNGMGVRIPLQGVEGDRLRKRKMPTLSPMTTGAGEVAMCISAQTCKLSSTARPAAL